MADYLMNNTMKSNPKLDFVFKLPYECPHPGFIRSVCTQCGRARSKCGDPPTKPFAYIRSGMSITIPEISRIRDKNLRSLISRKKLELVVDLDHTLLHATSMKNLTPQEISHLTMTYGGPRGEFFEFGSHVAKLRPGARDFLQRAGEMFDLSIFTMGNRAYATSIALALEAGPTGSGPGPGSLFGKEPWRVMSREDSVGRKKTLDVVLNHERVVLIVDDTEEVWENHRGNLVKIAPYLFFHLNQTMSDNNPAEEGSSSQFRFAEDEEQEKGEFARVLKILGEVHQAFYAEDNIFPELCEVTELLQRVQNRQ